MCILGCGRWGRAVPGQARLRLGDIPDPKPGLQTSQSSLRLLVSIQFCTTSRSGTEPSRPTGATVALFRGRGKIYSCHAVATPNWHWMQHCLLHQKLGLRYPYAVLVNLKATSLGTMFKTQVLHKICPLAQILPA